ncbi:hypothetical protein DFR70_12755 [Nocardia tenerifensis]|uniref:Uncharacterized protein n=1 Tax=Nocardia tenerifensis TaxID=228006 RepID=A0A318JS80_9NOCA|nr:hypothetical protein [Nocardia tenerifensis]PXX53444.1 hypothetical protein DFR70_12755 [Nocardia tenerifensis]
MNAERPRLPGLHPGRYAWRHLDRVGAAQLWEELTDWVDWLRTTYQLGSRIPGCWYRHPSVREELTALMAAHYAAYYCDCESPDLPTEEPIAWHTQWLWPTVERLTRNSDFSGCRPENCRFTTQPQPTLGGLADYIAADLNSRDGRDPQTR